MYASAALFAAALAGSASATIIWDGRLNNETTSAFLNDWSFSNEVGQYQYYIHGDGATKEYVNLGEGYKNPADTGSDRGIQITIDNSSVWNNDGMLRTELIPQTSAPINKGKVWYHFSIQHTATGPPSQYEEHQVAFFEGAFTELQYGLLDGESGTSDNHIHWMVSGVSKWSVEFKAGVWHNIAYAIDFDAQTVGYWHSTGSDDLVHIAGPISASTSSNGADWHVGVLRLPSETGRSDTAAEHWHFSGVYIENGELTKSVSGPGAKKATTTKEATTTKKDARDVAHTTAKAVAPIVERLLSVDSTHTTLKRVKRTSTATLA